MADIPSSIVKMNDDEIDAEKPVTAALFTKMGANINGLIDELPAPRNLLGGGPGTTPDIIRDGNGDIGYNGQSWFNVRSQTLTTLGGPIRIEFLAGTQTGTQSESTGLKMFGQSPIDGLNCHVRLIRDDSVVLYHIQEPDDAFYGFGDLGSFDNPPAGSRNWKLQIKTDDPTYNIEVKNIRMALYEIMD